MNQKWSERLRTKILSAVTREVGTRLIPLRIIVFGKPSSCFLLKNMFNKFVTIFFSLILVSVVIITEVLDCVHREPLQNIENTIQDSSVYISVREIVGHSCDVNSSCSHTVCHANHFCNAKVTENTYLLITSPWETYSRGNETIYNNPYFAIFLRPPIFV